MQMEYFDVNYRQAVLADIPAMSRIRLGVTENVLSDPGKVTRQMYEDYLEACGRGWVAQVHGVVVGFCYADRRDGSIWALFIEVGHEGRGHARRLLALALDWLVSLGFERVTLGTGADTRAERFYAAQGWRRVGVDGRDVRYEWRLAR